MTRKGWIWVGAGALGLLVWGIAKARAAVAGPATSVDVAGAAGSSVVPAGLTPTGVASLPFIAVTSMAPAGSGLTAEQLADRDAAAAHFTAQVVSPLPGLLDLLLKKRA